MVTDIDCLFCRIVDGEVPADVVYETDVVIAFRDTTPQAPVHVLVVPKNHYDDIVEIADVDDELLGDIVRAAVVVAEREHIDESGFRLAFNTGAGAGQAIFHLHGHVLGGRQLGRVAG